MIKNNISYFKENIKDISNNFKYILDSRKTWWYIASCRTKERFSRTILGGFWLGISNSSFVIALSLVYGIVFQVSDFKEFFIYLGLGITAWNYISTTSLAAPELFSKNQPQINNTNNKHIYYVMEEWAFQLQTFLQSLLLILVFLSFFKFDIFLKFLSFGIPPLLNLILFCFWFPLLISILGIRYRDFYQLIPIAVQFIFLISPFIYRKENLGPLTWLADYNPFYIVVSSFRDGIINSNFSFINFLIILLINLIGIILSILVLEKIKKILPFLT